MKNLKKIAMVLTIVMLTAFVATAIVNAVQPGVVTFAGTEPDDPPSK